MRAALDTWRLPAPWATLALAAALACHPGCTLTSTIASEGDDDAGDDDAGDDDASDDDAGDDDTVDCPVEDYPERSPDCGRFIDHSTDGIQPLLNRTTACSPAPTLGQPAEICWDDGPTGTERYLGFCINVDDLGVCVPGHLGPDETGTMLVWDDEIDCIPGEVAVTTEGARTCIPLCVGQDPADAGTPCAGGRVCALLNTDLGEQVVCGG